VTIKGNLFILSAPSGAGKSSLINALLKQVSPRSMQVSVSHTTRNPRPGENHGEHYHFVTKDQFKHSITQKHFYEYAQQVRMKKPDVTTIFISPPSKQELENRLRGRGQDSEEVIQQRMAQAQAECSHYHEFDYIIINDNFEQALADLTTVVQSQRLKCSQQVSAHHNIFAQLLA